MSSTDITTGRAAIESWRLSYDNGSNTNDWTYDYVGACGINIENVQISGAEISCTVEVELYSDTERNITASTVSVLFIVDRE